MNPFILPIILSNTHHQYHYKNTYSIESVTITPSSTDSFLHQSSLLCFRFLLYLFSLRLFLTQYSLFFLLLAQFFFLLLPCHCTGILVLLYYTAENIVYIFYTQVTRIVKLTENFFLVAQYIQFFLGYTTAMYSIINGDIVTTSLSIKQSVLQKFHC